ncbi:unnamed protein product [Ectocarpus sp. CCAP 1310/34]|nr:unnamed protein product [Ectocarpus sp. CCAP 1310/34]
MDGHVKALRRALKDVPATLGKNERFRRVSALVGGTHNKKACYEKYKELKAEAKLKAPPGDSRDRRAANKKNSSTGNDGEMISVSPSNAEQQQDEVISGSTAAGSVTSSTVSGLFSGRSSATTLSSWSSDSADRCARQEQQRQEHVSSMKSNALSSVSSGPPESGKLDIHGNFEGDRRGYYPGKSNSRASTDSIDRPTSLAGGGPQTAKHEEELMEVDEVDVEDFCLDEELVVEPRRRVRTTTTTTTTLHTRRAEGGCQDWNPAPGNSGAGFRHTGQGDNQATIPSSAGGDGGRGSGELPGRTAVTEVQANGVRELVFGNPSKRFNDAWREQGFFFCGEEFLRYGLVQVKGGPCGVLAAVQAFLLEDMIFGDCAGCDWRNPKKSQREHSLTSALSTIIWRAGDGNTAVLAVSEGGATVQPSSRYRPDGFTERLKLIRVGSRSALEGVLRDNLHHYTNYKVTWGPCMKKGQGVILLVYSCVFSRGVDAVRGDMDNSFDEPPPLMASHGYASQELVNLLLVGRARSNVFDGCRVMGDEGGGSKAGAGGKKGYEDRKRGQKQGHQKEEGEGGGGDRVVLTGVSERGRVGFLTLFEAYKHVEVGDRLKNPETPIWVVCSESHYSVLFSVDSAIVPAPQPTIATREDSERQLAGGSGGATAKSVPAAGRSGRGNGGSAASGHGSCGRETDGAEAFDLEYYDGLGRQDETIRLTVDQRHDGGDGSPPLTTDNEANDALIPPLDLVIRTRWPEATVDWNGTDPIL